MGRRAQARAAFEAVLEMAPGCLPAHADLASLCVELGDGDAALAHATALHAAEGDSPRALLLLARAKRTAGQAAEACAIAARVLALDPGNQEARELAAAPEPPSRASWIRRLLGFTK